MYIGETTELSSDIFCVTVWTSQAHRGAGTKNVLKLWDGKENKKAHGTSKMWSSFEFRFRVILSMVSLLVVFQEALHAETTMLTSEMIAVPQRWE